METEKLGGLPIPIAIAGNHEQNGLQDTDGDHELVSHDQVSVLESIPQIIRGDADFETRGTENLNSTKGQRKGDFQITAFTGKTVGSDNCLDTDAIRYTWQDAMNLFHKIKTTSKDEFLNSQGHFMDIQHSARMNLIDKKQREQGINLQVHIKIAMALISVGVLYFFRKLNIFFPVIKNEFNLDKYSPGSKEQWRRYDEMAARFAMEEAKYENYQPDWKTAPTPKRGAETDAKRRKQIKDEIMEGDRTEEIFGAYVIEDQVFFKIRTYSGKIRFVQVGEVCDLPQFQKFLMPLAGQQPPPNQRVATKEELQLVTQPFSPKLDVSGQVMNPMSVQELANQSMNLTPLLSPVNSNQMTN